MTATDELIRAALAAAELFREGDTPDQPEIRVLVRAADAYQPGTPHTVDGCLLCAVRELTEGSPQVWNPTEPASVSGVILRVDQMEHPMGGYGRNMVPFVDLWTGQERVRIVGYASSLARALELAEGKVGDRLTVAYEGRRVMLKGRFEGREYKVFTAEVARGHH